MTWSNHAEPVANVVYLSTFADRLRFPVVYWHSLSLWSKFSAYTLTTDPGERGQGRAWLGQNVFIFMQF